MTDTLISSLLQTVKQLLEAYELLKCLVMLHPNIILLRLSLIPRRTFLYHLIKIYVLHHIARRQILQLRKVNILFKK